MKSKKRYVIGFWIAASLVVIMAIGMVAVLSAFQAVSSGGNFSISYTAYHVNAEMTASYKAPTASSYAQLNVAGTTETTMVFDEEESATKTFADAPAIKFTKSNKTVVLRYSVKNTGSAAIKVSKNITETTKTNVTIKYAMKNAQSSIPTADPTSAEWKDAADSALADGTSIASGKILVFYVQITLTADTDAAQFAGAYNFTIDAVDAN